MKTPLLPSLCATLLTLGSLSGATPPPKPNGGSLDAVGPDGRPLGPCPLRHTDVQAEISGTVARVTVTQIFHNPFPDKIEAIYVFPLHQDSAVDAMTLKVGNRTVTGIIKERDEAARIYREAREAGKVAALLDQERPNIFTQSVASIEPGAEVTVTIGYSQKIGWEAGMFSFDFPTVVGPRYIPGQPGEAPPPTRREPLPTRAPDGRPPVVNPDPAPPTPEVPDANRITPPVVEEGFRAGHDIAITVRIRAGRPIARLASAQHEIDTAPLEGESSGAVVTLKQKTTIPNRDFVLTWRTDSDAISDALLTHTSEKGNFFSLTLQPPARITPKEIVPRDLIFVLDTSGSMSGVPVETSKSLMRRAIENLRPNDRFNIVTFAGDTRLLFDSPVANTEENRHRGLRFIDTLKGGGGTEMMKAIRAALAADPASERLRIVCFLTDGYVGNDLDIVGAVKDNARSTRVFSLGIGSSVNRFLLDAMAAAGRGEAHYVTGGTDPRKTADALYDRIDAPVLTDIRLEFEGVEVSELYPERLEDLFSAKPVVITGRYRAGAIGKVHLRGRTADGPFVRTVPIDLPATAPENAALGSLWARAKVAHLMMQDMTGAQRGTMREELKKAITDLGLAHNLLTPFTSFVAVEEVRITEGGKSRTLRVPVEMPQDVSYSGVFGESDAYGGPAMLGRAGMVGLGAARSAAGMAGRISPQSASVSSGFYASAPAEDASRADRSQIAGLEAKAKAGTLTESERREQLLPLKVHPDLLKAAANPTGTTPPEPLSIRVALKNLEPETLKALERAGFELLARTVTGQTVIGRIDPSKLEALALLESVLHIDPIDR